MAALCNWAYRQNIAGLQCPSLHASKSAAQVGGQRAQYWRQGDAAGYGQVGPAAALQAAEFDLPASPDKGRHPGGDGLAVYQEPQIGAAHRDETIGRGPQRGSGDGDLQAGRAGRVAHETVGGLQGKEIHGARDRDAHSLVAAPAEVLYRGE